MINGECKVEWNEKQQKKVFINPFTKHFHCNFFFPCNDYVVGQQNSLDSRNVFQPIFRFTYISLFCTCMHKTRIKKIKIKFSS